MYLLSVRERLSRGEDELYGQGMIQIRLQDVEHPRQIHHFHITAIFHLHSGLLLSFVQHPQPPQSSAQPLGLLLLQIGLEFVLSDVTYFIAGRVFLTLSLWTFKVPHASKDRLHDKKWGAEILEKYAKVVVGQ
jgi:hypothetical protein